MVTHAEVMAATENITLFDIDNFILDYGDAKKYQEYRLTGQRYGEAFFNSLDENVQSELIGTPYNPANINGIEPLRHAVAYLSLLGF